MASALSAGASAAIKYSIAILGRAPSDAELNTFAAAYAGSSAAASEDAVASAILTSTAGVAAMRPNVFSASKQASVILANHGVTDANAIAFIAGYIDGTAGVKLPLASVVRIVANLVSNWNDTPANPYNAVLNTAKTTLTTAVASA